MGYAPKFTGIVTLLVIGWGGIVAWPVHGQETTPTNPIDLPAEVIEDSPVLQKWLRQVPDVLHDIDHDPAFRPRLRVGYSQFPSTDEAAGWQIGLEDVRLGQTRLTLSGDYRASFNGDRASGGADLRYYLRPLGQRFNLAPVVGYRALDAPQYTTDGLHVGLRLVLIPSRTGAADLALSQTWVAPGSRAEVGLTTLSVGYAITPRLRLGAEFQKQNARQQKDSQVSLLLEWQF